MKKGDKSEGRNSRRGEVARRREVKIVTKGEGKSEK